MNDPAAPPALTVLQRASSGRLNGFRTRTGIHRGSERPALILSGLFLLVFVVQMADRGFASFGLSAQALAEGRWPVLIAHMFSHADRAHLSLNLLALLSLGPVVMSRLGAGLKSWLRFLALFLGAGLAGAFVFLAFHPAGDTPMVGASGAIFGLWGASARMKPDGGAAALGSREVLARAAPALIANLVMIALFLGLSKFAESQISLAWEAHLGGFLFGLLASPGLLPRSRGAGEASV